jgi:hypothetical protein
LREMGREKQLAKINFVVLMSTDAARIVPRNKNRWWTVESIFSMVSMVLLVTVSYKPQLAEDLHSLARGLEERRNFKELLTESVGRVHFS